MNLGEPLVADYGVRDGHQEREEMEIVHRCDLGRSPNPWHETISDPCRIVAVARKLGEERAVFGCGVSILLPIWCRPPTIAGGAVTRRKTFHDSVQVLRSVH